MLPGLLCGATTWPLTATGEERPETFGTRLLRRMLDIIWDDLLRNKVVRTRLQQLPVGLRLTEVRLIWFRRVERTEGNRQPSKVLRVGISQGKSLARPGQDGWVLWQDT